MNGQGAVSARVSRTNNTHARDGFHTWSKRHGNKVARVWARQRVKELNVSVTEELREDITADQLEERGALREAMKIRNREEPELPRQPHDCW